MFAPDSEGSSRIRPIPFQPPFFYGWVIAIYAGLIAFSSGPGQSYLFSVFLDSIIEETGFSRSSVSILYALGTGVSAAMVAYVSRLADRHGSRRILVVVGCALAAACFTMATATNIFVFIVAFAALRALGQGSLTINGTLLIAQWFSRYRARAVSIMGLGFAASTSILPPLSRFLIDSIGWREAYAILGVLVWLLIVPAAFFLVRDTPERAGLLPDGVPPDPAAPAAPRPTGPIKDDRRVLTSLTFWMLAIPLATPGFVLTALIFHQAGIFEEHGLSATVSGATFVPYAIASASLGFMSGFILDRSGPRMLVVAVQVTMIVASFWMLSVGSVPGALVYGALLGATGGMSQTISGFTWAHFYGRDGLGRIQGSAMMITISGAALGPLPLALLEAQFGGFDEGILVMMLLPLASILSILLVRTSGIRNLRPAPA